MSRPDASHVESSARQKVKPKPSKTFDFDSQDDTNYEALAASSPHKAVQADDLDAFLSDDDPPAVSKVTSGAKASSSQAAGPNIKAPLTVVPGPAKARGRPQGAKNKPRDAVKAKPTTLSPAAKAYAAKKAKASRKVVSDDDDDDDVVMQNAPHSRAAPPRGRPGRAAAAKAKPVYIDLDEDDSMLVDEKDEESDDYEMDDSD
jgi:DNA topoisomerase-2